MCTAIQTCIIYKHVFATQPSGGGVIWKHTERSFLKCNGLSCVFAAGNIRIRWNTNEMLRQTETNPSYNIIFFPGVGCRHIFVTYKDTKGKSPWCNKTGSGNFDSYEISSYESSFGSCQHVSQSVTSAIHLLFNCQQGHLSPWWPIKSHSKRIVSTFCTVCPQKNKKRKVISSLRLQNQKINWVRWMEM